MDPPSNITKILFPVSSASFPMTVPRRRSLGFIMSRLISINTFSTQDIQGQLVTQSLHLLAGRIQGSPLHQTGMAFLRPLNLLALKEVPTRLLVVCPPEKSINSSRAPIIMTLTSILLMALWPSVVLDPEDLI